MILWEEWELQKSPALALDFGNSLNFKNHDGLQVLVMANQDSL